MTALSKSLPQWTGWHTKEHLMVVWRENHAFHSGGLDHSVKKLTFPRQLSILFPFSGGSCFLGPRGGERSCHPPISNVYDYE